MAEDSYRAILNQRLRGRKLRTLDVESVLTDLALITYAVPRARLEPYIPARRFEIPEFSIGGKTAALMSAVPFIDADFRFPRLLPFLHFAFPQTNYRVYVIDRKTKQHGVWFFGTTLGSPVVYLPRLLWRLPWHYACYQVACQYDRQARRYHHYRIQSDAPWGSSHIDIGDSGEPVTGKVAGEYAGFDSYDAMKLILTHPVSGFYYRLNGRLGTYTIWHQEMALTRGTANHLYFSLYERLGLLSRQEMQEPVSILLCPRILFRILLPPRPLR